MPSMPTRPLWFGTFLSSQSMVSLVSVPSSIALASLGSRGGRDHHELPFRLVPAANVLKHEDVALIGQVFEVFLERFRPARLDAVRRPHHDEGQRSLAFLRRVNDRVQLHAVAHRDHRGGLRELLGQLFQVLRRDLLR